MEYSDIIRNIDDIFDYFKFHSKNLTKTQEYKLDDLKDLIHEWYNNNEQDETAAEE